MSDSKPHIPLYNSNLNEIENEQKAAGIANDKSDHDLVESVVNTMIDNNRPVHVQEILLFKTTTYPNCRTAERN